jgi:Tfp pilus assembly protein PilN
MFKTVIGIDPSGKRLAIAAVQGGVGSPAPIVPPACFELRSERESARLEEAEELLRDFVARNGLARAEARLCIPADRVYTARIDFPALRPRDLGHALSLELERLFPFPSSKLRFGWRRLAGGTGGRNARFLVVATPSEWLDQWEAVASRAGLALVGAVPSAWAVSAACQAIGGGKRPGCAALLRGLGDGVEVTLMAGGEPFFGASRSCDPDAAAAVGRALLEEGLQDPPAGGPVPELLLLSPAGWFPAAPAAGPGGVPMRVDAGFEARANETIGEAGAASAAWSTLAAFGAAVGEKTLDLLAPESEGPWPRIAAATAALLAVAALALAVAWPATRYLKARAELARLDARVAALAPAVARVGDSMAALSEIEDRIAILREASPAGGQPLEIMRDLTARLPQGTWLTGLRLEGAKVEMDGFSPSASEIFPLLAQDGRFRKVEFASPITRQPDNLERFQIRAEFAGAPAAGVAAAADGGAR